MRLRADAANGTEAVAPSGALGNESCEGNGSGAGSGGTADRGVVVRGRRRGVNLRGGDRSSAVGAAVVVEAADTVEFAASVRFLGRRSWRTIFSDCWWRGSDPLTHVYTTSK